MFSLRDSSSASSSGTDEDSFGWWIGIESHTHEAAESSVLTTSDIAVTSSSQPDSVSSDSSGSSSISGSCSREYSTLAQDLSTRSVRCRSEEAEHIELRSLDVVKSLEVPFAAGDDNEWRRAMCYTPERLIRSNDYRIVAPSPRFYPTLAEMSTRPVSPTSRRPSRCGSVKAEDERRIAKTTDDGKIGADQLAALLSNPSPLRSAASSRSSKRCCCIKYGDGEVLLHTEHCPKTDEEQEEDQLENGAMRLGGTVDPLLRPYSEYGSCCDEGSRLEDEDSCTKTLARRQQRDFPDDTSGVSSVDGVTGTRGDNWSCTTEEEEAEREDNGGGDDALVTRLPRRFSDELAYVSFEFAFAARQKPQEKTSDINEVVSILADLNSDPSRAEALLLGEDRFREAKQSNHDCFARLALTIEPDVTSKIIPATVRRAVGDPEAELERLRDRVERLQDSSRDLYEEVSSLRKDFSKDEWKVNHLSEDINKLRNEVYELRYLDDLLKLLKGELERISNRNWPFAIGHTKLGTEEINLVV